MNYFNEGDDEILAIMEEMRREKYGDTATKSGDSDALKSEDDKNSHDQEDAMAYEKKYAGEAIWNPDVKVPRSWLKGVSGNKVTRFVDNHVNVPYELLRKKTLSTLRKAFANCCTC